MRDSLVFLSISANVCVLISPLDICSGIQVWSGIPSLCMLSSTCYSGFSGARSMASLLMSKGLSFPLSCWVWNARVHRRFSLATGPLPSLCLCWEKRLVAFPMWSLGKQPGCEGSLDEERSSLQLAAHPADKSGSKKRMHISGDQKSSHRSPHWMKGGCMKGFFNGLNHQPCLIWMKSEN